MLKEFGKTEQLQFSLWFLRLRIKNTRARVCFIESAIIHGCVGKRLCEKIDIIAETFRMATAYAACNRKQGRLGKGVIHEVIAPYVRRVCADLNFQR
jgi:hypothetical protein